MGDASKQAEQGCLSAGLTVVGIFGLMGGVGGLFSDLWVISAIVGCVSLLILFHQYRTYRRASPTNGSAAR
jgi:uncharacterized membrane protein